MQAALIVTALVGGMVSGGLLAFGLTGAITGRVFFNPRRIDWSLGEARFLGLTFAVEGLVLAAFTLTATLQLAANRYEPLWFVPLLPLFAVGGPLAVMLVRQHHNRRTPSKRW